MHATIDAYARYELVCIVKKQVTQTSILRMGTINTVMRAGHAESSHTDKSLHRSISEHDHRPLTGGLHRPERLATDQQRS